MTNYERKKIEERLIFLLEEKILLMKRIAEIEKVLNKDEK